MDWFPPPVSGDGQFQNAKVGILTENTGKYVNVNVHIPFLCFPQKAPWWEVSAQAHAKRLGAQGGGTAQRHLHPPCTHLYAMPQRFPWSVCTTVRGVAVCIVCSVDSEHLVKKCSVWLMTLVASKARGGGPSLPMPREGIWMLVPEESLCTKVPD